MIGPLTSAALWLAGFWLEIFLWSLLSVFLYSWLFKYFLTRYLVAYPGVLLVWNVMGWIFCFCIWFIYALFSLFYNSFLSDSPGPSSDSYLDWLGTVFIISTITISFFALRFIYNEEKGYWEYKRLEKQKETLNEN